MEVFRPPGELKFSCGNVKENWRKWRQQLENYLLATEKDSRPAKTKIAILLNLIGSEGVEIFNTFKYEETESSEKYEDVLKKFDDYCVPRQNVVFERYKFFSCNQQEGQSIDNYITQLKTLASTCEFNDQEDGLIRDRIVLGIRDIGLQERLLREPVLGVEKAADLVRAAEASKEQLRSMKEIGTSAAGHQSSVYVVKQKKNNNSKGNFAKSCDVYDCKKCGKRHKPRECPAYGKICSKCKQKNHFAVGCKQRAKKVNEVEKSTELNLYVDSVLSKRVETESDESWLTTITLYVNSDKIQVDFKLDTGAEVNILPLYVLKSIKSKVNLDVTNTTLMSYGDFKLVPKGTVTLKCSTKKHRNIPLQFYVLDVESKPILGLKACSKLNLIQKVDQIKIGSKDDILYKYNDVFSGTGEFPDEPYHIVLKEDAVPVVHPPRRVPQAIQSRLKETLNNLEKSGIISRVNKPTDWVQSLVIVEKPNGNLRLCLDPRDLNKVIKREHYLIPSAEDIISRLEGKKVFSVLDLKDGFWQVPLDAASSEICTFNTPFGRFKFNKMPFGIASAPEVFQKRNQKLFGDIKGVEIYFDDIIVAGFDDAEHDAIMSKVLERAKMLNVKFNANKFQFRIPEVKYMGQIISSSGIKADPNHIKGVIDMPTPTSKTEVRRVLGMINFLSKFIPNVSNITAPLREVTKQSVEFKWDAEQEESFDKIKSLLTNPPVLKVFNGTEEIIIQCDASKDGLGTCLIQKGKPVSFMSRSLTESEKNYAQIEKELLAIVFSFEKYHNWVYGRKVIIQSDHRPLMSIVKKPMHKISSRMQKMLLKLLKYDYEVRYVPGTQMYLADTLSRAFKVDPNLKDDPEMMNIIHSITKYLPMSQNRIAQFQKETELDPELKSVLNYIKEGWPESIKSVPENVRKYHKLKNDLHTNDCLVFLNDKIVVPYNLRGNMLRLIHEAHFGIEKCKKRAREIMYWPGMVTEIENVVAQCEICEKFKRANTKEPLKPHLIPDRPFEKVGVDIMEFGNISYLVLIDYYSKWLEVCELSNKSANEVINKLKCIFSQFGVPNTIVSDNIPFNSYTYKQFANEWDFDYAFISPHHSPSNGMVERGVGIAKSLFRKAREGNKDYHVGLMEYRNSPISGLNLSPAQMMFNRRLKTKLPITNKLLNAELFNDIHEKLVKRQETQKFYYDRTAHPLPKLNSGDSVGIRNFVQKTWEPAEVISKDSSSPRSYFVKNQLGKVFRRNRKHLKKSNVPFVQHTDPNNNNTRKVNEPMETTNKTKILLTNINCPVNNNDTVNSDKTLTRSGRISKKPAYLKDYV